jgi:hypothetical protein
MLHRSALPLALLFAAILPARAAVAGSTSSDAVGSVLEMLEDPSTRSAKPPALDPQLQALAESPELSKELYELAGDIFSELVQSTGGDIGRMNDAVARAKSDPEKFAASLSPATRARLKALADKIEAQKR